MTISREKKPITPHHTLILNNGDLEHVESYKYLGLLLTADLSWSSHISSICLKARKILGLLYRRFYGNVNQDVLKQLYLSLVRPHLEYGCHVGNPHLEKDKKALENLHAGLQQLIGKKVMTTYLTLLTFRRILASSPGPLSYAERGPGTHCLHMRHNIQESIRKMIRLLAASTWSTNVY